MLFYYKTTRNVLLTFLLLLFSCVFVFAESKENTYNELMKNGSVTDIKKALMQDNEMILTKIGPEKDTLLMKAIEYGRAESIVSLMLKSGISPLTKNKKGQDALMYACRLSQDPAVIRLIISKCGSESGLQKKFLRKDKTGNSAWDYANQNRGPQATYIAKKYVGDVPANTQDNSVLAQKAKKAKEIESAHQEPAKEVAKAEPKTEKKTSKKVKPEKSTGPKGKVQEVPKATEAIDEAVQVSGGKVSFSDYTEPEPEPQMSPAPAITGLPQTQIQEEPSPEPEPQVQPEKAVAEAIPEPVSEPAPQPPVEQKVQEQIQIEPLEESPVLAKIDEPVEPAPVPVVEEAKPEIVDKVEEKIDTVALKEPEPEAQKVEAEPVSEPEPEPEVIVAKSTFSKKKPVITPPPVQEKVEKEPVPEQKEEKKEDKKPSKAVAKETKKESKAETKVEEPASKSQEKKETPKEQAKETPKKLVIEIPKKTQENYNSKQYLYDYAPKQTAPQKTLEETNSSLAVISEPNKQDKDGRTPLMLAVKNGNDWEIKSLLKSGANVNIQDKDGWTALMYAVRYQNNIEITNLLIKNGANTQIQNKFGKNALTLASCYSNNPEIVKKILTSYPVGNKEVFKAFILAITSNTSSTITQLAKLNVFIDTGIPMNRFYEGKTPLMYAAEYAQDTDILKLLLNNGAITTIRNSEGKTAFNFAEYNSQLEHNEVYWSLNNR